MPKQYSIKISFWHEKLLYYPDCPVSFISACLCYRVTLIDDSGSAWQSYNIRTISQEEYETQMLAKIAAVLGKCSLILIDIRSTSKKVMCHRLAVKYLKNLMQ